MTPTHPLDILAAARDILAARSQQASAGLWSATDLTASGHPGVWWVEHECTDDTGALRGVVAELETVNGAHDAAWIALMTPGVVGPLLVDALTRASEVIAWSRDRPDATVAEFPLLTFARRLVDSHATTTPSPRGGRRARVRRWPGGVAVDG
jgi:hypothetical protein